MFVYYIVNPQIEGGIFISESYADWNDCFEAYTEHMEALIAEGIDLSVSVGRGVQEQGA